MTSKTFSPQLICALTAATAMAAAAPAQAEDNAHFRLAVTAGSLGAGPELSYEVTPHIALRVDAAIFSFSTDHSTNQVTYSSKLKLKSAGLKIDYFPSAQGGFFVSGGLRLNRNRVDATGISTNDVVFNGNTYTAAQLGTVTGQATFADLAPTLSVGYRTRKRGISFGIEAGAMYQGTPTIGQITSDTGLIPQVDLDAEQAELQSDADSYKFYPIVQLSLGYQF